MGYDKNKRGIRAPRLITKARHELHAAYFRYDFATDGGVIGAIVPQITDTIPNNAIMVGATINSPTAVLSGGAATVAIGTVAGSSAASILGATAKASLSIDALINGVPVFATPVKLTADGKIQITVATANLTAGVIEGWVYYVLAKNA